ncbi:hypothetical protein CN448_32040 [Bacillus cereus]|uniref:hypothetical protein n=1 Tax=Bacillus cereus TaxID=1396 RepID=UPI000BFAB00B|nr:hypothetical protein [Bacillus cereus]PEW56835.1 hypothetical protein CN448_32040 [Bacillus cereus]
MKEFGIQGVLSIAKEMGSGVYSLFNTGLELMPYLGRMVQTVKFNRLSRRMDENSMQLHRIGQLSRDSILAEEYISQRIFPIVLADLIEEHEDAKFNLVLNGFENVFVEENGNESIVINYFDTLRNLRYKDVKRILYLSGTTDDFPQNDLDGEEEDFIWSIDNKLERQGLVVIERTLEMMAGRGIKPSSRDRVHLTPFGMRFLKFIQLSNEKVAES